MTAIIIDDEKRARVSLTLLVKEFYPSLEIVAECENLPQGVKAIRKLKPNLVFLDIEMPGHSGLELLDFFDENEINFEIIFTTAYNEYAVKAFKFSAIDYLLKPISFDRFIRAVDKVRNQIQSIETSEKKLEQENFFFVKTDGKNRFKKIRLDDICYLESIRNYVILHTESEQIVTYNTLKYFLFFNSSIAIICKFQCLR